MAFDLSELGRKVTLTISPLADVQLSKATQLLRAFRGTPGMPSQGEVLCWVLECFPVDEMFRDHFGVDYPGVSKDEPSKRKETRGHKPSASK